MSRIFALLRRDLKLVRGNVIAIVVCVGLAVIPSLYAWFNIAGGWDPYGNTAQVKVALANSDAGVSGSLVPFQVNVGERVVTALTESTKVGYVVTTEDKAVEGVRSGEYYAAVVIPENFSSNLLSVLTNSPTHPKLDYYVNEKRNAIASIVTGKVSGSVQNMIDTGFTEAVTEATADLFSQLTGSMDNESVAGLAQNLTGSLDDSTHAIRRSADDLAAYQGVIASVRGVLETSTSIVGENSAAIDAAGMLSNAADGVRHFDSAATTAEDLASSALDAGSDAATNVAAAIDEAFEDAGGKADELKAALDKVDEVVRERRADLQAFYDALEALNGEVYSFERDIEIPGHAAEIDIAYTHTVRIDISDLLSRTSNALSYLDDLITTCEQTVVDLEASRTDAESSHETLRELAMQAQSGIDSIRDGFESNLSGSLGDIASVIDDAAGKAASISESIHEAADKLTPLVSKANSSLSDLETELGDAADKLDAAANKLDDLRQKLATAMASGDMELVRTIMGNDPVALADFISAPVELDREAFFAVQNNGSAMTPYYTTMALWVGGTLAGILIYGAVSKRALEETGAKPRQAYFGRLAFFLVLGACQSTILLLGDLFFLGVQCQNPLLFLITGWVASTVFINIIFALSAAFGDAGKAIAVFIMVVQVAGSGGTFPVQMLPRLFQTLYPFLPFVYSENAMRAAMFGVYNNDWLVSLGTLALFLVPALILGLVLRKPLVPVNEWIEEKMEETKLM